MLIISVQYILCDVSVRPTVIETAVYVNSIGPVDPINMVRLFYHLPAPLLAGVGHCSKW